MDRKEKKKWAQAYSQMWTVEKFDWELHQIILANGEESYRLYNRKRQAYKIFNLPRGVARIIIENMIDNGVRIEDKRES